MTTTTKPQASPTGTTTPQTTPDPPDYDVYFQWAQDKLREDRDGWLKFYTEDSRGIARLGQYERVATYDEIDSACYAEYVWQDGRAYQSALLFLLGLLPEHASYRTPPECPDVIRVPEESCSNQNLPLQDSAHTRITYAESRLPLDLKCPSLGYTYETARCAGGTLRKTPLPCRKCDMCFGAWQYRKLERYSEGIRGHKEQTIIVVDGLADDDEASAVRSYLAKRFAGIHKLGIIGRNPDTYLWRCVLVTQEALPELAFHLASYALRNRELDFTIDTRPVPAIHLERYLTTSKVTDGGHKPTSFSQGWIHPEPADNTYQFSGRMIHEVPSGEKPVLAAKHRCDHCDDVRRRYGKHPESAAVANATKWLEGLVLDRDALVDLSFGVEGAYERTVPEEYAGPRRLITDTAAHIYMTPDGPALMQTARMAHLVVWINSE